MTIYKEHPQDKQFRLLRSIIGSLIVIETNYDFEEKEFSAAGSYLLDAITSIRDQAQDLELVIKSEHDKHIASNAPHNLPVLNGQRVRA